MTTISIVYHSGYGHTKVMAESVATGANRSSDTETSLLSVEESEHHWDVLDQADAIIFGCPTYLGSASAAFKKFMETTSSRYIAQAWLNKVAAGFTNSGSMSGDKLSTLIQLFLFAAQHGMHWINLGLPSGNSRQAASVDDFNRLGGWMGAMAQSNIDEGPDQAPPESDRMTAEHLGYRVAEVTKILTHKV